MGVDGQQEADLHAGLAGLARSKPLHNAVQDTITAPAPAAYISRR